MYSPGLIVGLAILLLALLGALIYIVLRRSGSAPPPEPDQAYFGAEFAEELNRLEARALALVPEARHAAPNSAAPNSAAPQSLSKADAELLARVNSLLAESRAMTRE